MDGLPDVLHDLTTPPPTGNPVDRVLARARRDRRRRAAGAVVLAVTAVAAIPLVSSALSGPARNVPASYPVVPWKFLPAGPEQSSFWGQPLPNEGEVLDPACQGKDVHLQLGTGVLHDDTIVVPVTLTNEGDACQIDDPFSNPRGRITHDGTEEVLFQDTSLVAVHGPPIVLAHGASASSALTWHNCGSMAPNWRLTVFMGTGEASADSHQEVPAATPCARVFGGSPVMSFWVAVNSYGQPLDNPQAALTTALTAPESGHLGEVLHLTLRMTNPSRGPVSLTPCPRWQWSVSSSGAGSGHVAGVPMLLNCGDAPDSIGPGEHVDFALELPLSSGLADGLIKPGTWYVSSGFPDGPGTPSDAGETPNIRAVEILAPVPKAPLGPVVDCGFAAVPQTSGALETPDSKVVRADLPTRATVATDRGDLQVELADDHPCGVAAFAGLARQGRYDGMPATRAESGRFNFVVFGRQAPQPGFVFPSDVDSGTRYPAGTVLFYGTAGGVTTPADLLVVTGSVPFPPEFTPVGRVTQGLDTLQAVAAAGGDSQPKQPVTIKSVSLR